jgi:hypothetical protein
MLITVLVDGLPALLAVTLYVLTEGDSTVGLPEIPHVAVLKDSPVIAVTSGEIEHLVTAPPR